jgi:hypothetical protein
MPAEAPDPRLPVPPVPSLQSEALLTELECWRDLLARDIIEKHPAVTEPDLNYTILRTILQLLFVKIAEERGLVGHGTLQRLSLTDQIHDRLCGQAADDRIGFLTGIFQEDGNGRPLSLAGDEVMRTIAGRMESFEFPSPLSTIPLPELAGVFEQYLGSKMRLAEGYRVQRDHTSMIRDAGGVHIPPQPVVNYIARETIEHLAEGKTPREVSRIRILDPACGSGIFLLSVYRHLLDWHLTWYRTYLVSVLASKEHIGANGIHTLASGLPAYEGTGDQKSPIFLSDMAVTGIPQTLIRGDFPRQRDSGFSLHWSLDLILNRNRSTSHGSSCCSPRLMNIRPRSWITPIPPGCA